MKALVCIEAAAAASLTLVVPIESIRREHLVGTCSAVDVRIPDGPSFIGVVAMTGPREAFGEGDALEIDPKLSPKADLDIATSW